MIYGNPDLIAVDFSIKELNASSKFLFGNISLIVKGKKFFSFNDLVTLNIALNHLRNEIQLFKLPNKIPDSEIIFFVAFVCGDFSMNKLPQPPDEIVNSKSININSFVSDYYSVFDRMALILNANVHILFSMKIFDAGGRLFILKDDESEIIVCSEDVKVGYEIFRIPFGSYESFINALPEVLPTSNI